MKRTAVFLIITMLLGASFAYSSCSVRLSIAVIDVGQGDSIVIWTSEGQSMLVDCGPPDALGAMLCGLRNHGISALDYIVLSHPHIDHVGRLADLLSIVPVQRILDPGKPHGLEIYAQFLGEIDRMGIEFQVARAGQRVMLGPVSVDVLWPMDPLPADVNSCSVVLRITHGDFSALLTWDAEAGVVLKALSQSPQVPITFLKLGHHGSRDARLTAMLSELRPEVVIISAGISTYKHPHPEVIEELKSRGIEWYSTDNNGTVILTTTGSMMADGRNWSVQVERASSVTFVETRRSSVEIMEQVIELLALLGTK